MLLGEGSIDDKVRMKSVENHKKWVEAAKHLGCGSIRVNARGEGMVFADLKEVSRAYYGEQVELQALVLPQELFHLILI